MHKPITAPHSDSKQKRKEIPDLRPSASMKNQNSTFKASNTTNTDNTLPKPEYNTAHKTQWTQTSNTQRPQQHKTNMANHRSLKRTMLQAETQKTAKNSPSLIVIPSKTGKKFPKYYLQPTWKIAFQHSKIEEQVEHKAPIEHFKEHLTMHSNGQDTRATPKPTTLPGQS